MASVELDGQRVEEDKQCPDCAESIKAAAKICRYCGYRFEVHGNNLTLNALPREPRTAQGTVTSAGKVDYGIADQSDVFLLKVMAGMFVAVFLAGGVGYLLDGSSKTIGSIDTTKAALICKAGIAKLFQQPASTMKAERLAEGITRVSYRRLSDNTLWKNDCRLEANRIIWRAVDASPGSGPGRWRVDPADGFITYSTKGDNIEVTETY